MSTFLFLFVPNNMVMGSCWLTVFLLYTWEAPLMQILNDPCQDQLSLQQGTFCTGRENRSDRLNVNWHYSRQSAVFKTIATLDWLKWYIRVFFVMHLCMYVCAVFCCCDFSCSKTVGSFYLYVNHINYIWDKYTTWLEVTVIVMPFSTWQTDRKTDGHYIVGHKGQNVSLHENSSTVMRMQATGKHEHITQTLTFNNDPLWWSLTCRG